MVPGNWGIYEEGRRELAGQEQRLERARQSRRWKQIIGGIGRDREKQRNEYGSCLQFPSPLIQGGSSRDFCTGVAL